MRHFGRDILQRNVLGNRRPLVAAFDIGAEPPALERNAVAKIGRAVALRLVAALPELLRIFAIGVIGAGDERSESPSAQAQPAVAALRANARIAAVGARRIEPGAEELVEGSRDLARLLVHDLAGFRLEVAPEVVEQFLPVEPPARNIVELFLELGGVIVADILLEEALEECRDQPPTLLGHEPPLVDADIFAVLQRLQDRGVSGWTPDPQFLQPLDQARFGITRRRLGEMLGRFDTRLGGRIALAQRR